MNKIVILGSMLLLSGTAIIQAHGEDDAASHRSVVLDMACSKPSFYDKCFLAAKGLGALTLGSYCAGRCIYGAAEGQYNCVIDSTASVTDKAQTVCIVGVLIGLAALMGEQGLGKLQQALA